MSGQDLAREERLSGTVLDRKVLRRMLALLAPHRGRVATVLVCEMLLVATIAVRPWFIAHAIDAGLSIEAQRVVDADLALLIWLGLGMSGTWLLRFAIEGLSTFQAGRIAIEVLAELRRRIVGHIHRLDVAYFDRTRAGRIVARADRDVDTLEPILIYGPPQVLATSLRFGVAVVLLGVIAPPILVGLLVLVPVLFGAMWLFKSVGTRLWGYVSEAKSRVTAHLVESIQGVRVLQQTVAEARNREAYREHLHELDRRVVNSAFGWAWFPPFTFILFTAGLVLTLWLGGEMVAAGTLSLGELTQCVFYVFLFLGPLMELGDLFERAADAGAAARRIFLLLDTPARVVDRADAEPVGAVAGELHFDHVRFAYDSGGDAAGEVVLPDLELRIPAGETCAIVGPTGHGKSTMVQLLARFYDVQGGAVRIDGRDVRDLAQGDLRRHVSVVLQDNVLFSGTILDNLRLARAEASDEELIAACRRLGADHVLERMPAGYRTEVGSEGQALSHGTRQLVCLVRASLADPAVLVLDEATSAIDLHTERRIRRALAGMVQGRTAVVVAHRLATIRDADRIVVIEHGRIAEQGSHDELLAAGGRYADLHASYLRAQG